MAEDLDRRIAEDKVRLDLTNDDDVRYWTERFGITREDLIGAVHHVGVSVDALEAYLSRRSR